jgi:hypothetical protein
MKFLPAFCSCLHVFIFALLISPAGAQDDNFDDGNDTGWTRFTPLGAAATATYSVSGGVYNMSCSPSNNNTQLGPSRCAALRLDRTYSTFCTMVDIVNFGSPATEETSAGIIARIQPNPALGTVKAYTFTYQSKTGDVEINRTTNEKPTNLGGTIPVTLQEGTAYRMIFFGVGSYLEGRIYSKSDLSTPLVVATATDDTYTQGTGGIFIFSNGNTQCSASFDNYSAANGTLAPPAISANGTNLTVLWDTERGLGRTLQGSSDLSHWSTLETLIYLSGSTFYSESIVPTVPYRFFRLRLGP